MVLGFMRKTTHDAVVEEMQKRIDYLEFKADFLQEVVKTHNVAEKPPESKPRKVKASVAPAPVEVKQEQEVTAPVKRRVLGKGIISNLGNPAVKKKLLEEIIPNVNFSIKGGRVYANFNGKMAHVRISREWSTPEVPTWGFTKAKPGEIGVIVEKDDTLKGVFVVRMNKINTVGSCIINTEEDVQDIVKNTKLVLRNFK